MRTNVGIRSSIQVEFAGKGERSGARHQFLVYKTNRLAIPSNTEYSVPQLRMMIREVEEIMGREVTVDEWSRL